jgi:hypothetical protein
MSKILSSNAIKALYRIGDIMVPKNEEFPSYSEVRGLDFIDDVLVYAPENDIADLNMLLSLLNFMPTVILKWLVSKMAESHKEEGALAVVLRQLDFGIRGIIFSTYYTEKTSLSFKGKKPIDIIGYNISRL